MILVQTPSSDLIPLYKLGIVKNISGSIDRSGHEKLVPWNWQKNWILREKPKKHLSDFEFETENKIECQHWRTPWLNISVLLFNNFVKPELPVFRSFSYLIFRWIAMRKETEVHCSGNFPCQSHSYGLWTGTTLSANWS